MEDQYGMPDLRQYISGRPVFPPIPPPPDLLSGHRGLAGAPPHNPYDMLLFRSDSSNSTVAGAITTNNNRITNISAVGAAASSSAPAGGGFCGFEMDVGVFGGGGGGGGGDGGAGRWPRQETLTLLEIRSRLDPKFKEANQKGPLWDEVSRIMSEEHGYQRSGKKCREKFENLYKYYKKTKDGKAGRQDGKHYRFFRQLEALYGEASQSNNLSGSAGETHVAGGGGFHYGYPNKNYSSSLANADNQEGYHVPKVSDTSLSLSNYSESDTTSSDDSEGILDGQDSKNKKKRRGKRGWKVKIKEFIDGQMKKIIEKQEAWMEKMMRTIENKEKERVLREEEWRKQDVARMEREFKFWASERAWIESRDAALMNALHKLTGKDETVSRQDQELMTIRSLSENNPNDDGSDQTIMTNSRKGGDIWPESEIARLIQVRMGLEIKFQEGGMSEESMWDEIANRMACFGHERRSGMMCKDKWDSVNDYLIKCNKKRKEISSKSCSTYHHQQSCIVGGGGGEGYNCDINSSVDPTISLNHHHGNSSSNNNNNDDINNNDNNGISGENCFRYFMGDAYGRIMD